MILFNIFLLDISMNNIIWNENKLLIAISKVIIIKVNLLLDRIIPPIRFSLREK